MSSEFCARPLAEVASIGSGKRPPVVSKQRTAEFPVPIIGGGGVSGFTSSSLFSDDLLITGRVGTLGKLHVSNGACWPSDNALVVRPRDEVIDFAYLRYALCAVIDQAIGMNRGAANPLVTQGDLGKLLIPTPARPFQVEVGATLKQLDDRITLLCETNATLEAIAQALFKSWFVDFDPVRAKMAGHAPEGMDETTAALFPDALEETELRLVPKGWQLMPLADAFELNPSRPLKKGVLAPYLDMASVATSGHRTDAPVMRELGSGTKFRNGDTLLARITPCLENGKAAFVDFLADQQIGWGSTEFLVMRPKGSLPDYFAYLLCKHQPFLDFAIQSMVGTSGRQRIQNEALGRYPIAVPTDAIALAFGLMVASVQSSIAANDEQAKTLATMRDTLLPRLISGQLRLPEAQAQLVDALA